MGNATATRRSKTRHPWDEWFAKSHVVLHRNKHYRGMSHSMAQAVRNAAALPRFRLRVSVHILDKPDRIAITIHGPMPRKRGR